MNSMTGFGVARREVAGGMLRVEVQSLNGRYLSLRLHLPDTLRDLTPAVETKLKAAFHRGSVHCRVSLEPGEEARSQMVNLDALEDLCRSLQELRRRLGLAGEVSPEWLLAVPGLVEQLLVPKVEEMESEVLAAVDEAIARVRELRASEGANIREHLSQHCQAIGRMTTELRQRAPAAVAGYRDRLRDRVGELLAGTGVPVEEEALEREVAYLAERSDVTEELNRIESHLKELDRSLKAEEPQGRKLEFVGQELGREVHTVGAKAADPEMAGLALALRQEVERIREQGANVE